jgi:predicted ATPase/Tfp pilus assembly protein PilF
MRHAKSAGDPALRPASTTRGAVRQRVERLLASGQRAVTLVGPPGIGKTWMARARATEVSTTSRARPLFCDLAHADSVHAVCASVARALRVELPLGRDPLEPLAARLATSRGVLLILDDAERAMDATALALSSWLVAAPDLRCLVTSRSRLGVPDEVAVELDSLTHAEGFELFVDCARAARDTFALRDDESAVVGEIVRRLDAVPLALQLAAQQTVLLRPAALLAQLDDPRLLLDAPIRDPGARHTTLRSAVERSWELLDEHARSALVQCAAFRGAFDLSAAGAVVEVSRGAPPLVEALRRLRDSSLLCRSEAVRAGVADGHRLPWVVRVYAEERLMSRADLASVWARHARFYLSSVEHSGTGFAHDNLLAIAARGLRTDVESGVDLSQALQALSRLGDEATTQDDVLGQLDLALSRCDGVAAWVVARARLTRGRLLLRAGRWSAARADFEAALEHADDAAVRAAACVGIGNLQRQLGKRGLAERAYRAALEHHVEAADVAGRAKLLASLGGMLHERGRVAQARALHERALALHRELSDERGAAVVLQNLGLIMQEQGQLDAAEAAFQQAHRLHVELGNRRFTAIATFDLACLCCERGLWSDAASRAQAALEDLRANSDRASTSRNSSTMPTTSWVSTPRGMMRSERLRA